jgi:hypothetical protein
MSVYGVSGSGTYAVTLSGLDELMSALPNNTVNQIRAQDARNVVYTLWDSLGGGGGGSFSYTQTLPLTQPSSESVGGIPANRTFSNVALQSLFDQMFFPAVGTGFTITTNPSSYEVGRTNMTTTVEVTLTKNTPTITSAFVTSTPAANTFIPDPTRPTNYGQSETTPYTGKAVTANTTTTFTLTINDGTVKTRSASVVYFYPRFYGSIDLNGVNEFGNGFQFKSDTSSTLKELALSKLRGTNWNNVWNPLGSSITKFTKESGQLSLVTIAPVNSTDGSHGVFLWPSSDYSGDGEPTSYFLNDGTQPTNPVVSLGITNFINQYGVPASYSVWIRDFPSKGSVKYKINA